MPYKTIYDTRRVAAEILANNLRESPCAPPNPEQPDTPWLKLETGARLPPVHCAFRQCHWHGGLPFTRATRATLADDPEHPWDQELRAHITTAHRDAMQVALQEAGASIHDVSVWDLYKQAVATKERNSVPAVGASIDRRCFEHLVQVYNDQTIRQLLCFCCAQSKTDVSTCRSSIGFRSTKWLLGIQPKTLLHNFSRSEFEQKFARPGTPLAQRGSTGVTNDLQAPDFTEWTMRIDPTAIDQFLHSKRMDSGPDSSEWEILELKKHELICCPEDVQCERTHAEKTLCLHCRVPICKTCQVLLESKKIVPTGLCNDNWIGYPQAWVYEVGVTWMERTVATPYWTGMTLFTVTSTQKRRHIMHDPLYGGATRVAFRGQVFSAPMDWHSILDQLEQDPQAHIALPHTGSTPVLTFECAPLDSKSVV